MALNTSATHGRSIGDAGGTVMQKSESATCQFFGRKNDGRMTASARLSAPLFLPQQQAFMKHWIAVISLEHAQIAAASGFLQVCHGKAAPLKATRAGDAFFIYCSKTQMTDGKPLKQIAFHGHFMDDRVYQVEQFAGFHPWRKDVRFDRQFQTIALLSVKGLELTRNPHWGMLARRGFFEISAHDAALLNQSREQQTCLFGNTVKP